MDFSLSAKEEAFRDELRAWLAANLPDHRTVYPPRPSALSQRGYDAERRSSRER